MSNAMKILKLGRVHFVLGGFLIFAFGALLAQVNGAQFDSWKLFFGYLIVFCAHLSVSYSNDYYDFKADRFVQPTPFSGGSGILQQNPGLRTAAKNLAIFLIIASLVGSVIFVWYYSFTPYFFIFILAGNMLGWFYTAPPVKLSYRGMGEISTLFTLGFLLPGTGYFILAGNLDMFFMTFSAVFLIYGLYFMLNVQFPDMEGDRKGGKRTLIVKMGRKAGLALAFASSIFVFLVFLAIHFYGVIDQVNVLGIALLSIIPVLAASATNLGFNWKSMRPSMVTTINMSSLMLFILLLDLYILFI